MSDRFPALICIGGTLKESLIDELCVEISGQNVTQHWDGNYINVNNRKELEALIDEDGYINLMDSQALYGEFTHLESWLKVNDIPFNKRNDGMYEHPAEVIFSRPGSKAYWTYYSDSSDKFNGFVPYDLVNKIRSVLKRGHSEKAIALLDKCLGPKIPPLPKFKILDGK